MTGRATTSRPGALRVPSFVTRRREDPWSKCNRPWGPLLTLWCPSKVTGDTTGSPPVREEVGTGDVVCVRTPRSRTLKDRRDF